MLSKESSMFRKYNLFMSEAIRCKTGQPETDSNADQHLAAIVIN